MSYDIYLRAKPCPTCSHAEDCGENLPEPTYNLTPIFDLALTGEPLPNSQVDESSVVLFCAKTDRPRGLRLLSGRRAGDTIADLQLAITRMIDPKMFGQFSLLEPANGWGSFDGARKVFGELLTAALSHPDAIWSIR